MLIPPLYSSTSINVQRKIKLNITESKMSSKYMRTQCYLLCVCMWNSRIDSMFVGKREKATMMLRCCVTGEGVEMALINNSFAWTFRQAILCGGCWEKSEVWARLTMINGRAVICLLVWCKILMITRRSLNYEGYVCDAVCM